MPERFGIRTSIRITSGISSWAFATTSTPSDASPTSSRSASWSRTIWSPRRNSAWSSQTRTRSFSGCSAAFSLMPAPFPWRYPASSLASGVAVVRLPGFYATCTPDQARSLLLVVVPDLAFELLHQHVERGLDVAGVRAGPIALARCRRHGLDPMGTAAPGVLLVDHLDLQACELRLHPLEPGELALGDLPETLGDAGAPPVQHQIHPSSSFAFGPSGHLRGAPVRGPRPADLVFGPTPACRGDRRPRAASHPLPARSPPPRQDLHLNRAMLTDQGSAYVGRFARGWHRLPGNLSPGQPQTRTRAHRRVYVAPPAPQPLVRTKRRGRR